jgi:predicted kinase
VVHNAVTRMPTAHLISGLPCSGKTTYARALRETTNGVLFSLDYWLITLHGRYSLDSVGHEEHVRRVVACRHLISDLAEELLRHGLDVILDDGFFLREDRLKQIAAFQSINAKQCAREIHVQTHIVQVPFPVLRTRLANRNVSLPEHNFSVTPEMLERFLTMYEEPLAEEGAELLYIDGRTASSLAAAP